MSHLRNAMRRSIQFFLLACALHAFSAHAQSNADAQNSIQALNVSGTPSGSLVLQITLKNPLTAAPGHFSASSPARLVFDFAGTKNDLGRNLQEINQGDLRSVNITQGTNRTRVVVNMSKIMAYEAKIDGSSFVITLSSLPSESKTSHFAEPMPGALGHSLRDIDFHRDINTGSGRIEVALSDPGTGIDIRQQGNKIVVDFINTSAPRNLLRKVDVTDFATPVESLDTFVQGDNVRMIIAPKGQWDHSAYQTDNKFVIEVKPKPPEERRADAKPVYSGKILTLNFQNIAVREALGVIADFTGLNIVISDTVSGNLTLRLKDVPWDQALDIILQSKGLDMSKNGNVVQVAPRDEIAAIKKVKFAGDSEIRELEPTHTESFVLSYQRGEDIVALISNKDQRILSKRGSAVVDKRTNLLFVNDISSSLEDVRALIKQIDVPVRQVMIEARFVSAADNFTRTLGGRLSYANSNQAAPAAGFHVGGGQLGNANANVNLPGAASGTGGLSFSLFNPTNTKTLQLELAATEADGGSKNIASPRVVTADNVPATISSGVEIPYQQSTSSGATAIAFVNASLSLNVTPQITPDDHVNMKLTVSQDSVGSIYGGVPSINSRKVNTQVLVDNGGTVVIGGIYTKDYSTSNVGVPLLRDIPILGWLFKSQTVTDNKSELLIFISPKIMKSTLSLN